jgi:hypothetical protein
MPQRPTAARAEQRAKLDHLPGGTLACLFLAVGYYLFLWSHAPMLAVPETGQVVRMRQGFEAFFVTVPQAVLAYGLFMLLGLLILSLARRLSRSGAAD